MAALLLLATGAGVAGLLAWWASRLPPHAGPADGVSWRVLAMVALAGVAVVTLSAVSAALRLLDELPPKIGPIGLDDARIATRHQDDRSSPCDSGLPRSDGVASASAPPVPSRVSSPSACFQRSVAAESPVTRS